MSIRSRDFWSFAGASALGGALALVASAAEAQGLFYWGPRAGPAYIDPRALPPSAMPRIRRFQRLPLEAEAERHAKKASPLATVKGPLLISISIDRQRLKIYDDGQVIAESPVSTGMQGHSTPMGVFSVIQKERFHRSNLYSAAPMPFMQRITWSGVALHAGVLPGYPASHGCIRMPSEFAVRLYGTTKVGARVVIARGEVEPHEFAHPRLFVKKDKPVATPVATIPVVQTKAAESVPDEPTSVQSIPAPSEAAKPPEPPALDRPDADAIQPSAKADPAPAETPDGTPPSRATPSASDMEIIKIKGEDAAPMRLDLKTSFDGIKEDAALRKPIKLAQAGTPIIINAPEIAPGRPANTRAADAYGPPKPLRAGPVSIFISKKEGRLYVRKGFEPVFDAPVKIEGEAPLGTHVFTAMSFLEDQSTLRWSVLTMPMPPATKSVLVNGKHGKRLREEQLAERPAAPAPGSVLDRIDISQDALDRIQELMSPGASLTVSDQGLGPETGRETDFIVLTR